MITKPRLPQTRGAATFKRMLGGMTTSPTETACASPSGGATTKAEDVAVRVLYVEVLCAPWGGRERLGNRCTMGHALSVERLNPVHARRSVQMLVLPPKTALRLVLRRFLQVELQTVQVADHVKPIPGFAECET